MQDQERDSTEGSRAGEDAILLEQSWRLHESVSLRPEPFGALAYHFGNRRLSFLKAKGLVRVVESLATQPTIEDALVAAEVPKTAWDTYLSALRTLAASQMIVPNQPPVTT